MRQVCRLPAVIATAWETPMTSTGVVEDVVVPSPSWPDSLSPQHFTPPLESKAHAWPPPTAIDVTWVRPMSMGVGDMRPQHSTEPPVMSAQASSYPALIAATPDERPVTGTGTRLE